MTSAIQYPAGIDSLGVRLYKARLHFGPGAAKARRVLGWAPEFTLDEGLDRTIAWYREFLSRD